MLPELVQLRILLEIAFDITQDTRNVGEELGIAFAAIDLSGRPYAVLQAEWHSPAIGTLPTSLIPHFLESFTIGARTNLHARVEYGRDDHHQAEALFKALGRALDTATQIDPRRADHVPSTKGTL